MPGYRHGIHGLSPGLEDTRVWKMYRRDCLEMFFLGLFSLYFFFCLYILHRSVARGVRHRAWLCAVSVQFKTNPEN